MANLFYNICRDLYIVLLVILLIEQIPGNDLLHDVTRKGVIAATICVIVAKLVLPPSENPATWSSSRRPGAKREKKTECGRTAYLEWASSEMQGWRPAMEDAVCIVSSLPSPLENRALFAVFDGHGGSQVSQIAAREYPKVLAACAQKEEQKLQDASQSQDRQESEENSGAGGAVDPTKLDENAMHFALLSLDMLLKKGLFSQNQSGNGLAEIARMMELASPSERRSNMYNLVGSTAIIAMIDCGEETPINGRPKRITVANCGDSRAILCRGGRAVELSEDHKPELPREEERIRKAGGCVRLIGPCHRIDFAQGWGLNLSRALGDFEYKGNESLPPEEQKVIAVPEICTLELTDEDEFLVLACDGVFELNTSQGVIDIVRKELRRGATPTKAAEKLLDASCSENLMRTRGRGGDNCSTIVLKLKK